jgi:HK97 family phage major capsid protein
LQDRTDTTGGLSYLAPRTIIGRLQGLRVVPFNVRIPKATSSAAVTWVGQGHVKAASAVSYDAIQFPFAKVAGLVVVSSELIRSSDPAVEIVIRDDLVAASAAFMDRQFLDPSVTEVADVSPGSVTSTATAIPSSGSTATAIESDIADLIGSAAANSDLANPYIICKPTVAAFLASLRTTNGSAVFPNAGVAGGIFYADNGAQISVSEQTSIQMTTTPDSPETASSVLTSLWQRNLAAVLVERFCYWKPRRAEAVAVLTGLQVS